MSESTGFKKELVMTFAEQQMLEIIRVYEHHLSQFNHLTQAIEALKLENRRLRQSLQNLNDADKAPICKPRIVCRPL